MVLRVLLNVLVGLSSFLLRFLEKHLCSRHAATPSGPKTGPGRHSFIAIFFSKRLEQAIAEVFVGYFLYPADLPKIEFGSVLFLAKKATSIVHEVVVASLGGR